MSAQFTPAPWTLTDESDLTPDEPYWIGAEHPEVGRCTFATVRSGCDEANEMGDLLANAHLIAAAPSLYSDAEFLCARIREFEAELSGDDEASRQYFGHVLPAVARMESGLAEARGETSE